MSMIERAIYWTAIVVLVVALFGLKGKINQLEQLVAQAQVSTQVEE